MARSDTGIILETNVSCPDTTKADRLRAVQILLDHSFGTWVFKWLTE